MKSSTEELEKAKKRGFLLTERSSKDAIFRDWGRWCDQESILDIYARVGKTYAVVRLDMAPTGRALSEQALQQAIERPHWQRHDREDPQVSQDPEDPVHPG